MDERPRSPSVPRWRAKLVQTPLEPQDEPVALMVNVNHDPHVWARGSNEIRPLPSFDRHMPPPARDVLGTGGRWLVFARDGWSEDESLAYHERCFSLGLYRYDITTGQMRRATFDPDRSKSSLKFNASPDGQRVLVAQQWTEQDRDRPPRVSGERPRWDLIRCTVSLIGFGSEAPRELFTITGQASNDADDLAMQWSPDGTRIALSLAVDAGGEVGYQDRLLILDAESGGQISVIDEVRLVGSLSWSPDSQRLLTADRTTTLWMCDAATGQRHPIPVLPGPRPGTWVNGSPRLLGFADEHHVLVAVQRRATMTISALNLETGASEGLVRWSGAEDMYPTLAPMPAGYWSPSTQ